LINRGEQQRISRLDVGRLDRDSKWAPGDYKSEMGTFQQTSSNELLNRLKKRGGGNQATVRGIGTEKLCWARTCLKNEKPE